MCAVLFPTARLYWFWVVRNVFLLSFYKWCNCAMLVGLWSSGSSISFTNRRWFLADLSQIQRTMYSFKSPVDTDLELNPAHLFSDRFFFIKKYCLQYLPPLQLPWVGFNSAEHLRKVCIVDHNRYIPISLSLGGLNLHSKACVRRLICSKLLLRGRTQCERF